jgi:hypothetical protein
MISPVLARKEEIARFNKARTDQSFARMLKSRTLGPDHIEMQTQLRRDIRVCVVLLTLRSDIHGYHRPFVTVSRS